jgi:hypothetical protein
MSSERLESARALVAKVLLCFFDPTFQRSVQVAPFVRLFASMK